ncbi:MAG: Subtilase family, partial [Pseudomonadota bacterium]
MNQPLLGIAAAMACAALVGCGGGGGGNSATLPLLPVDPNSGTPITPITPIAPMTPSTPSSPVATGSDPNAVVTTPTQTLDLRWGQKATPYVLPTANNVTARVSAETGVLIFSGLWGTESATVPIGLNEVAPLDKSTSLLQEVWITRDVKQAWSQGWTGAGVKIGVIDDFTADEASDFLSVPLESGCNRIGDITTCASSSAAVLRMTHGDQVAGIAGGQITTVTGALAETGTYLAPLDLGEYLVLTDLTVQLSAPIYGVAKDALIHRNDFLTYQRATNGLFSEFKRWGEATDAAGQLYRQLKVVNLSLGGSSRVPKQYVAEFQGQLAYANASKVPDAVFVKAAGNSACTASSTDCDPYNAVLYAAPDFKSKALLVGALDQPGGRIAAYSNRAGNYADRFLVADGRGIQRIDGSYEEGTSFAAP